MWLWFLRKKKKVEEDFNGTIKVSWRPIGDKGNALFCYVNGTGGLGRYKRNENFNIRGVNCVPIKESDSGFRDWARWYLRHIQHHHFVVSEYSILWTFLYLKRYVWGYEVRIIVYIEIEHVNTQGNRIIKGSCVFGLGNSSATKKRRGVRHHESHAMLA